MKEKKLKDLKKGDMVWLRRLPDTTPIIVTSAKRDGNCMRVTLKWDDNEYECFGHALGYKLVSYSKEYGGIERLFTSSYEESIGNYNNEKYIISRQRIGEAVESVLQALDELKRE